MSGSPSASGGAAPGPVAPRLWSGFDLLWLAFAFVVLLVIFGLLHAQIEPDPVAEVHLLIASSVLSMLLPVMLLLHRRPDRRAAVGLVPTPLREARRAVIYLLVILPISAAVNLAVAALIGDETHPQSDMLLDRMDLLPLSLGVVLIVIVVPIVEELLFRGVLLAALLERGPKDPVKRKWAAIIASSLIFGLFHVDPQLIGGTTVLGIGAALLRVETGSLWPAILLHQLNNALATVLLAGGLV